MGQHDPLDGYLTCLQLRATAAELTGAADGPDLEKETRRYAEMMKGAEWITADPLGIGGLLSDACRVEQLICRGARTAGRLSEALLASALAGLRHYARGGELQLPAEYRLAFRELGLAIGLHAVERMAQVAERGRAPSSPEVGALLQALLCDVPIGQAIESFWLDAGHREAGTWAEHRDINEVMLATCLAPDGFLQLFEET